MEMLTNLIANPLEAVINTITGDQAVPAAAVEPTGNATFTEDVLRMLVYNLFQGDSRLQQQVLQDYYAPDCSFSLNGDFLRLTGRDELQQLLRGSQLFTSYKPEILEISSNANKAVILLNLNVSYKLLPLTWFAPLHLTTTITLNFGPNPNPLAAAADYADLVIGHHQEMSLVDLFYWNPVGDWLNRRIWSRISGKTLAAVYHIEEPIVSKFSSYLDEGAGYFQAMLWSLEDVARAAGLEGLPSAAVKLNLIPSRAASSTPPPKAAAPAAAAPATAADADTGYTEGPRTPTRGIGTASFAAPAAAAAAAAPRSELGVQAESESAAAAGGAAVLKDVSLAAAPAAAAPGVVTEKEVTDQDVVSNTVAAAGGPTPAAAAADADNAMHRWGGEGDITPMPAAAAAAAPAPATDDLNEGSTATRWDVAGSRPPPAAAAAAVTEALSKKAEAEQLATAVTRDNVPKDPKTAAAAAAEVEASPAAASSSSAGETAADVAASTPAAAPPAATAADVSALASTVQEVLQDNSAAPAAAAAAAGKDGPQRAGSSGVPKASGGQQQQQQGPQLTKQGSKGGSRKHKRSGSRK